MRSGGRRRPHRCPRGAPTTTTRRADSGARRRRRTPAGARRQPRPHLRAGQHRVGGLRHRHEGGRGRRHHHTRGHAARQHPDDRRRDRAGGQTEGGRRPVPRGRRVLGRRRAREPRRARSAVQGGRARVQMLPRRLGFGVLSPLSLVEMEQALAMLAKLGSPLLVHAESAEVAATLPSLRQPRATPNICDPARAASRTWLWLRSSKQPGARAVMPTSVTSRAPMPCR